MNEAGKNKILLLNLKTIAQNRNTLKAHTLSGQTNFYV